ncbi:hypothetical protein EIN_217910 [Entamoeba invadens IP1]|uniref:Ribosome maturation protein SDO1/SBDS central domain-containing protein n=1 Tax=Entamoeba invadens IP1 TaxID=370355 RepID=L7FPN3_ENTIV|nr:hypothetical protein EIN_217910 [Entamoeba invadens IP1]ELP95326.1 hypothetical protein EIN_217910 [Entamoeba invadens IP1]|eukprot:XP_004262097.1 hypothetical protein EIN_217910 [Entamoeba invadens IP1]
MSKANYQVVRFKHENPVGKLSLSNATFSDEIYMAPHQKGTLSKPTDLAKAFPGLKGTEAILQFMAEKGEIQFTTEERKQQTEEKKKRLIEYVHMYYVDPTTDKPHPVVRINNAFEAMHLAIDPDAPMEKEIKEIEKKINAVLPMKRVEMEIVVTIPENYCKVADPVLKKSGKVAGMNEGGSDRVYRVTIVPGDFDTINKELAKVTRSNYQIDTPDGHKVQKDSKKGGKNK